MFMQVSRRWQPNGRVDEPTTERQGQWDRDRQQKRLRVERQHSSCLIRFPSLFPFSSLFRWLASADHLAGAWEQLPPSQGHTKVCSRARWVCSDSRHIHEGSWSEAAASQKLEDRLIGWRERETALDLASWVSAVSFARSLSRANLKLARLTQQKYYI